MTIKLNGTYFCGNQASDYAIKNGYLDYATLSKAFDAVLNNSIIEVTTAAGYYWEQESGIIDNSEQIEELEEQIEELEENEEENEEKIEELREQIEELEEEQENSYFPEIMQYYIVSDNGASILEDADEIVFYNSDLDMYVWGVTHWGTSWDYVLTNIPLNCKD